MGQKQDGKNTLLLFADTWIDAAAYLDNDELGALFRATLYYFQTRETTTFEDRALKMKFGEVVRQMEYSGMAYKHEQLKRMYVGYVTKINRRNEKALKKNPEAKQEPVLEYDDWYAEIYLMNHPEDSTA